MISVVCEESRYNPLGDVCFAVSRIENAKSGLETCVAARDSKMDLQQADD